MAKKRKAGGLYAATRIDYAIVIDNKRHEKTFQPGDEIDIPDEAVVDQLKALGRIVEEAPEEPEKAGE